MRILDPDSINLGLEDLGLREDNLRIVKSAIERPQRPHSQHRTDGFRKDDDSLYFPPLPQ
ncbi:hypothetical protein D6833_04350 [Candidatus Parcubacteria bacterium]|nr:MAG: hypothetical protein D6833_04350 [Candidatus Parcubacteria bacterium]